MSNDERDYGSESDADKRAHHNALERKRRDHIKYSFSALRDTAFADQEGKVKASRAQILRKAAEEIRTCQRRKKAQQLLIDKLTELCSSCEEAMERGDLDAAIDMQEEMCSIFEANSAISANSGSKRGRNESKQDTSVVSYDNAKKRLKKD